MIFLVLAVCCSLTIGMIFKHAGRAGMDRLSLLTVNYFFAAVTAAIVLWVLEVDAARLQVSPALAGLGLGTGVLFICSFFLLALATSVAGMSLAIGVMRVSVVIPFLASWWLWGEVPTVLQGIGLVVAGGAFFMISRRDMPGARIAPAAADPTITASPDGARVMGILALLFLVGGTVDTSLKAFGEMFAAETSLRMFLLIVFVVAFLVGLPFVVRRGVRGIRLTRAEVGWGAFLGLVNYGSTEFFLHAIDRLSGPFVFPANHISLVVGAALLGVLVWGERLSRLNWLGIFFAAFALLLLSL
jgi:drug/metabolite transporter (DMT)-like permease